MSLLTITHEDVQGRGRPLPDKTYRATIEEASVETTDNGKQLARRYGNLRTIDGNTEFELPDGSVFRIGNRKVFARSWFQHSNEQAQRIGLSEIKREAISAGLVSKPAKGESVELNFDSFEELAQALVGREVIIRTRQESRKDRVTKKVLKDADGNVIVDVRVGDWITA